MTDQNVTRTYRVFVPSRYDSGAAHPLVVVFHGWGGDENEFLDDKNVQTVAEQRGYIVVAPRGLGSAAPDANKNSWSFRGSTTGLAGMAENSDSHRTKTHAAAICDTLRTPNLTYPSCKNVAHNTCSWTQCQADDIAFALALVKEVESKLCVDTARVFASGGSNGGMFIGSWGRTPRARRFFTPAASFNTGTPEADCRTYCGVNAHGWSGGSQAPGGPTCSTVEPRRDTRTTLVGRGS